MDHMNMDHGGHDMGSHDMGGMGHEMGGHDMAHEMQNSNNAYENMEEAIHAGHHNMQMGNSMSDMPFKSSDEQLHGSHGAHASHGNGNGNGHSMHGMAMTFHGGVKETILFSWWNVTDMGEFVGSFFAIFVMALFYEGLKYYRKHLLWKTYSGLQYCAVAPPDKGVANICATDEPRVIQAVPHTLERNVPTMLSTAHAWQTALHGLQVLVSYMLMLVFMTYNTWLCAAVVLGSASGYFLFGWRESVVVDFTEHCH